jgi:proline iminopeptidase
VGSTCVGTTQLTAQSQERQSILDSIVTVHEELITEIPRAPRLEEQLGITGRRVNIGDLELYVEDEGSGTPIVLLHGGPGGTHHYFHPWFSRAARFARVIYYDQRGCGLSDFEPGESGYNVDQAVEDLEGLRVTLGLDKFVLVGYSYGGFLAQYYTTSYPQNVAGLVLVGAAPGMWADLGSSRQYEFISQAERDRMRESREQLRDLYRSEGWSRSKYIQLAIYNNHINGDWKRQHFYKPSAEQFSQIPLYEWINDGDFNSVMGRSNSSVDLTHAFDGNPIPTLILEGKWDLTWGEPKVTVLSRNHPNARTVVVEGAGHSIYAENPDAFFPELELFLQRLTPVSVSELRQYSQELDSWRDRWKNSLEYHIRSADWGVASSKRLAGIYNSDMLNQAAEIQSFLRLGFALYDVERYADALEVFTSLADSSLSQESDNGYTMGVIWQGHMLDLLGKRDEAIERYQQVVGLNYAPDARVRHSQYGLDIVFASYAAERVNTPFERVENKRR